MTNNNIITSGMGIVSDFDGENHNFSLVSGENGVDFSKINTCFKAKSAHA